MIFILPPPALLSKFIFAYPKNNYIQWNIQSMRFMFVGNVWKIISIGKHVICVYKSWEITFYIKFLRLNFFLSYSFSFPEFTFSHFITIFIASWYNLWIMFSALKIFPSCLCVIMLCIIPEKKSQKYSLYFHINLWLYTGKDNF